MFRAACDNSVTTSAACPPTHSNLRIPKCPPAARFAPNQTRHVEGHDLRRPHSTPTNHPYARPTTATNTESSSSPRTALCRARRPSTDR